MKHISYSFTDSDIETCLFALTQLNLLLDDDISEAHVSINEQCANSAYEKLVLRNVEQITPNEMRVVCCCITYCNLICQGVISVDPETYKECMKHVFSLNKLDQSLASQMI